jgi:hypothetical protein
MIGACFYQANNNSKTVEFCNWKYFRCSGFTVLLMNTILTTKFRFYNAITPSVNHLVIEPIAASV